MIWPHYHINLLIPSLKRGKNLDLSPKVNKREIRVSSKVEMRLHLVADQSNQGRGPAQKNHLRMEKRTLLTVLYMLFYLHHQTSLVSRLRPL